MRKFPISFIIAVVFGLLPAGAFAGVTAGHEAKLGSWFIESAQNTGEDGAAIASAGFKASGWRAAKAPATVMGALTDDGVYGDVLALDNLSRVSSATFAGGWWYRTSFNITPDQNHARTRLAFDGINYRADIWLNGVKIASKNDIFGSFRRFELDITGKVKDGENILAAEVFPPQKGEPTIGFVDWNPAAPDKNMGLWREVRLLRSGDVYLAKPFVRTDVDTDTLKAARLTISADVANASASPVSGTLYGTIGVIRFEKKLTLAAGKTERVTFSPEKFAALNIKNPRLWWPHDLGKPELYTLKLEFKTGKTVSDSLSTKFGIRTVSDYMTKEGARGYRVNGKPVLIRGGGWADDIFLRQNADKLKAQVAYAKHMGLNTIRLEGFWGENSELFDLCDQYGILLMAGWSCQWEWENSIGKPVDEVYGGIISPEDRTLAANYWRDMVVWLRNHPSMLVWLIGSDKLPLTEQEQTYRDILASEDPTRPVLISAAKRESKISGPSGVKMNGPYDYVPPFYWYADTASGGAFGFNTETGPGPQVPLAESLEKMFSKNHLWPIDDIWMFHTSLNEFHGLKRYNAAMDARYGKPENLADYERKAQWMNYDGMRAMFEAFGANRFTSTGIVQWMYNSAWPKLWWQFFDYYLTPTGAFYGARKANEPLHAVLNSDDKTVRLVNLSLEPYKKVTTQLRIFDINSKQVAERKVTTDIAPNVSVTLSGLGKAEPAGDVYFADLRVYDKNGKMLSSNFYALPKVNDTLGETTWFTTYVTKHADMTALASMEKAKVAVKKTYGKASGSRCFADAALENRSGVIAFSVEPELYKAGTSDLILPVFWDDNFVTLLPHEKRALRAYYHCGQKPEIKVRGWNIF